MTQVATRPRSTTDATPPNVVDALVTVTARTREATPPDRPVPHVHDRTCWWDLAECRWAGPAHPGARPSRH